MRWPSIQVGDQPSQCRRVSLRSAVPSARRRGTARISAMVMSAVSSVRTPGVLVTVMPRLRAVSRSMLSTPVPKLAISLSRGSGLRQHRAIDAVGDRWHHHVGRLRGFHELRLRHRLVVHVEARIEQLPHARLDDIGQLARDDDQGAFGALWHDAPRLFAITRLVNSMICLTDALLMTKGSKARFARPRRRPCDRPGDQPNVCAVRFVDQRPACRDRCRIPSIGY